MFSSFKECIEYVREVGIDLIDFKILDLWGKWRHVSVPARKITEKKMEEGFGFDASNYGFTTVEKSDMVFVPDPSTAFEEEREGTRILSLICQIHVVDEDEPRFDQDPRYVCEKAENFLRDEKIADNLYILPELEFYVLDNVSFENRADFVFLQLESSQAGWNPAQNLKGNFIRPSQGYQAAPPRDELFDYRIKLARALEESGVRIKCHHHEVGAPGQVEFEVNFGTPVKIADNILMFKYIARNLALAMGKSATFMPKPVFGEAGSGMHLHFKMTKGGKNLFYDPSGYAGLSKIAHQFIGGILIHAKSLMAFTNPSTNSYRRLVPGYEAPISLIYAEGNRSAAIRIPAYAKTEEDKRFEYRPPDASCNPYLAFAALMMAGIDGIRNEIDPVERGFGPYEVDYLDLPESEKSRIKKLPSSLSESLKALEEDHHYLLEGKVFTERLIESWIRHKLDREVRVISNRPHPYEFQLYYDV